MQEHVWKSLFDFLLKHPQHVVWLSQDAFFSACLLSPLCSSMPPCCLEESLLQPAWRIQWPGPFQALLRILHACLPLLVEFKNCCTPSLVVHTQNTALLLLFQRLGMVKQQAFYKLCTGTKCLEFYSFA